MNNYALVLILRLLHVVTGIFWVGGVMIVAGFILPSVQALGPAGGPVMNQLVQVRKLPIRLIIAAWVTVLSGLTLYFRDAHLAGHGWYTSTMGRVIGFGGALGILVVIIGMLFNVPITRRMQAIGAQIQSGGATPELGAEMQRLQARLIRITRIAAVLLVIAASAMAVARYV